MSRYQNPPQILGIDAAVDPRNTGYAVATDHAGAWRIDALETGTRTGDLAERIGADRIARIPDGDRRHRQFSRLINKVAKIINFCEIDNPATSLV